MTSNPLIIALDVEGAEPARELIRKLEGSANFFKVGMELYAAAGPAFVSELVSSGYGVFLDLKFYDIGETVRRAVSQVARLGVRFLTIHGSTSVMRAAAEGKGSSTLKLLAVSVLTSYDESDIRELGYECTVSELVNLRVRNAVKAEADGIVCSPLEVSRVREITGPDKLLVTPGVRSLGTATGDQKRIATPAQALQNGANYLVIGRQVTRADDPRAEVQRILAELPG